MAFDLRGPPGPPGEGKTGRPGPSGPQGMQGKLHSEVQQKHTEKQDVL